MLKSTLSYLILFTCGLLSFAQSPDSYKYSTIPLDLINDSNAVVRYDKTEIIINDFNDVIITQKRIVTILSKAGSSDMGTHIFYDENRKIKSMQAKIYDGSGEEIKKFRKNDFEDASAVSGGTLYSDNRVKYLRYTPMRYPYTLEFEVEMELKSTAFLPPWIPIEGYYCSTEYSEYTIINNSNIKLKNKAYNLENYKIEKLGEFHYKAENLNAIKWEEYSPSAHEILPVLKVALTDFNMEGVRGVNNNWSDFGKWMYDKLLRGTDVLPDHVKNEILTLTKGVKNPIEKSKIVYKYVQDSHSLVWRLW